jgi:hypothetical protein
MILDADFLKNSIGTIGEWSVYRAHKRVYKDQVTWYITMVREVDDEIDDRRFRVVLQNEHENGIIWYNNVPYVLVGFATPIPESNPLYEQFPFDRKSKNICDLFYVSPQDIMARVVKGSIAMSISHINRDADPGAKETPFQNFVQNRIDSFYKGRFKDPWSGRNLSKYLHWVHADKEIEVSSVKRTVYLECVSNPLDITERVPNNSWVGCFDINTTPTSHQVGIAYRLAEGARIENHRIIPSENGNIFSETSMLSVFPGNTKPSRRINDRTAYEQNSSLHVSEEPIVRSSLAVDRDLHLNGHNCIVAFGYDGYNHMDAITVSRSFAEKFGSYQYYYQRFPSDKKPEMTIKVGDIVRSNEHICLAHELEELKPVHAREMPGLGEVVELIHYKGFHGGDEVCFTRVKYKVNFPLTLGCKITTRHATKGVIGAILPNEEMPSFVLDGKKVHAEALLNPDGVVKRGCAGLIKEMAHGLVGRKTGKPMTFDFFEEKKGSVQELQDMLEEHDLPRSMSFDCGNKRLMCGVLYFIRIDKHDKENLDWHGDEFFLNQYGLIPDGQGQMWNTTLSKIAKAKGLEKLADYYIKENRAGKDWLYELFAAYGIGPVDEEKETSMDSVPNDTVAEAVSYMQLGSLNLMAGNECYFQGVSESPQVDPMWLEQCKYLACEAAAFKICKDRIENLPAPREDVLEKFNAINISEPRKTQRGSNMYTAVMPVQVGDMVMSLAIRIFDNTIAPMSMKPVMSTAPIGQKV